MKRKEILINTEKEFISLKNVINDFIKDETGLGMVNVFVTHTTCAIKIMEGELLLLSDVSTYLRKMFKDNDEYRHDIIGIRNVPIDERVNGYAHMRQLFFSCDANIPATNGKLDLGVWQDIFLIEMDPIRERKVIITYYSDNTN